MTDQFFSVYVFDLDGVITNPTNSKVNEVVVNAMYALLDSGIYLAINTGRSYDWVAQNLISRLETHNNKQIFSRFISVCEKGGETVNWHDGHWSVEPSEFALSKDSSDIARLTFERNKQQLQTMFWDETKRTMATIEKLPSADLKVFHKEQALLEKKLRESLTGYDVRIDTTTIATDIELAAAGKYAGAKVIYRWIKSVIGTADTSFISFGDSSSDYEMARYFAEQQVGSTFVYVGKPTDQITHDERVTLITTNSLYSDGASEFLLQTLVR